MQEPLLFPGERSTRALGHAQASARLQHLGAEHERLRKKVLRRRRELERFETDLREINGTVSGRASSFIEEALQLNAAIHASFADILDGKKLSRRARARVREIYEDLAREGILTPEGAAPGPGPDDRDDWPGPDGRAGRHASPGDHADAPPGAEPEDDGGQDANASHRGRAAHLRDLRKTFLTLADAIHPDKVQDEEEKAARTEAMKELNRAYREGDLARILEIERAWNLEGKLDPDGAADEIERRCQALEHKNALLAEQLHALSQRLGSLRRTIPGAIVVDVRRLRRERDPDPIATVLAPLEQELDMLRSLASFVQSFQNGEMSLARFLEGPQLVYDQEDDLLDEDVSLDDVIELLQEVAMKPARGSGKKRRRRH
jgi:hypothetical protein